MSHIHSFLLSEIPDYERCLTCGTLHRVGEVDLDAFYAKDYWNRPNTSTIEEQVFNVNGYKNEAGLTKCESVLKYIPSEISQNALEIACAPGEMLKLLTLHYDSVVGIEYSDDYEKEIRQIAGPYPSLNYGAFPKITIDIGWKAESFDFIVGMDVLEHSTDPETFMAEVYRLIKPNGIAVMMLPVILSDGTGIRGSDYHPEHLFLPTQEYLEEWLGESFVDVKFDKWIDGHVNVVMKKPNIFHPPSSEIPEANMKAWRETNLIQALPVGMTEALAEASIANIDEQIVTVETVKPKRAYNCKPKTEEDDSQIAKPEQQEEQA